jgi:hypothetical protein
VSTADVDVCNEALRLLGEAAIGAFDEGTDLANTCNTLYAPAIEGLIALHPWRFSMRMQQLSRQAAAPLTQWSYAHAEPPDMLVLRALYASTAVGAGAVTDFERLDGDVLSNQPDLWAHYQVAAAPTAWPPLFRTLARYALAAEFAVPVTASLSAAQHWAAQAYGTPQEGGNGGAMRRARTAEAQQQRVGAVTDYPLIRARFGRV